MKRNANRRIRNIEIVKRMLEDNLSDEMIMRIADITQEQLKEYKQKLSQVILQ